MPRTVKINWGDGSPEEEWTGDKGSKDHQFPEPAPGQTANYQITVTPTDGGAPRTVGVSVPCGGTSYGASRSVLAGCVRPLVTAIQIVGEQNNQVVATLSFESTRAVVVVYDQNGTPVAKSAPVTGSGAANTAPVGPLAPGTYVARGCQDEGGSGYPSSCCEIGDGYAFTIGG
ncbi:hypothetical protein [Streptomyces violaceusniger]|uniref:Uncharacterized protein n=1 Tax=Streptomyces violaceusniger (strain Tu 4113) TaxID=653045 RepID=G2PHG3_STRV4|nr:hypothetical protein [Streptomyces violaceusniger]AEM88809.1 hypothetical protein Strvi_0032 [Streptomyces violaceusniger Tu 4113]